MKKVFTLVLIACFIASCNSSPGKKSGETKDAAINVIDDVVDSAKNTIDHVVDSAKNKMNNSADSAKPGM